MRLLTALIPRPTPAYSRVVTPHTQTGPSWRRRARSVALFVIIGVLFAGGIVLWAASYGWQP